MKVQRHLNQDTAAAGGTKFPTDEGRRKVLQAGGAIVLTALGGSSTAFAADSIPNEELDRNDTVEGYFLVMPKEERVFFISSEWLDYFEVPASLLGNKKQQVIGKVRGSGGGDSKKRRVKIDALYSNITHPGVAYNITNLTPPTPPGVNKTYLAMSISPDTNDDLG